MAIGGLDVHRMLLKLSTALEKVCSKNCVDKMDTLSASKHVGSSGCGASQNREEQQNGKRSYPHPSVAGTIWLCQ